MFAMYHNMFNKEKWQLTNNETKELMALGTCEADRMQRTIK